MALTELTVKQARPDEKVYTLSDGRGLILEVRPNGKKYWVIRYWTGGKERRASGGAYPEISLREAREKNEDFRRALKSGSPVGLEKETFSTVAEEWLEKRMVPKCADSYLRSLRLRLTRLIIPAVGHMNLADVTSPVVLQLCRRLEARGTFETASMVKQIIGQVFRYAIATGRAEADPTFALKGALQTRKEKHYATITEPYKIGLLIRHIEAYPFYTVRSVMKFSALVFCRPGEIRHAEWAEIDVEKAEWRIPAEKMKMRRVHTVPLARQALELLENLRAATGNQNWLFPSPRNDGKCVSENAVRVALRSMGYGNEDMTHHGFRGMASTILNEHGFPPDVIERQLAHMPENAIRAAYNHAEYMPQRREMMQWWADWLDEVKEQALGEGRLFFS